MLPALPAGSAALVQDTASNQTWQWPPWRQLALKDLSAAP